MTILKRNTEWLVFALLIFCLVASAVAQHDHTIPVIVDTDVALDDVRAITLLVQSDEVQLLAVVTSDGACGPKDGAENMRRILEILGRSDIPVASGRTLDEPPPPWRPMSESLGWSSLSSRPVDQAPNPAQTAPQLIREILGNSQEKIVYLCLGPLTNLADALRIDPSLGAHLDRLIYSGTVLEGVEPSWNTARDPESARLIHESGLSIQGMRIPDEEMICFDTELFNRILTIDTPVARIFSELHSHEKVMQLVADRHFRCWDEMAVLSLFAPELFVFQATDDGSAVTMAIDCRKHEVLLLYLNLLAGDISVRHGHREAVVLRDYPVDMDLFQDDIREFAPAIIERHGLEEWNAALIASELHHHLGVYALLGVKMGIRAREILGAGMDELRVISHAGLKTPLSCMTDGLQVSTGATLGHGLITVDTVHVGPAAVFRNGTETVHLQFRDEVAGQIRHDFQTIIEKDGLLTPAYWEAIRRLALKYWLEMDRQEIFIESVQRPNAN